MNIRKADFDTDALSIVEGARMFSQSTSLSSWFRSGDEFVHDISKIITMDNIEIYIAEHDGVVVGGIGISYIPYIWNQSILCGDELFWWAFPDAPFKTGRALFDFSIKRIEEKGAIPMFHLLDTSSPHIEKFYERQGLKKIQSTFTRVI